MSVVLVAAVCSWLLLLGLIPQLRRQFLDHPNARSSHIQAIPSGGGIAFVVVSSASSGIALFSGHLSAAAALPLLASLLAFVGLLDDHHNVSSAWRYAIQLLTAFLVLNFSPLVQDLVLPIVSGRLLVLAIVALLMIAVTAVINFTNFMDGLDGMVAGCMAISISAVCFHLSAQWPLWALVGALLGFLIWNWSPAKVFMGDVGSTFLGAVFAGLVLQASSWPEALGLLLIATPLLGDACLCVPRRLLAGQPVFQAHRLHLFQRLHQAGWTHACVSITYIAGTIALAVALYVGGWPWVIGLASMEFMVGLWLDMHVAVPFANSSQN